MFASSRVKRVGGEGVGLPGHFVDRLNRVVLGQDEAAQLREQRPGRRDGAEGENEEDAEMDPQPPGPHVCPRLRRLLNYRWIAQHNTGLGGGHS